MNTLFRSKAELEKILKLYKKSDIYKIFNCDKISLDKEIKYWNNSIKKEIDKSMEE